MSQFQKGFISIYYFKQTHGQTLKMSLKRYIGAVSLASLLLITVVQVPAAEPETAYDTYIEAFPAEIDADDAVAAGTAADAFKKPNPCEGMEKGDYLGSDVCADCHQDKIETMKASPHGQAADPRSPFGREGCETCHGPGMLHFETEGNCIISMTGRSCGSPGRSRCAAGPIRHSGRSC